MVTQEILEALPRHSRPRGPAVEPVPPSLFHSAREAIEQSPVTDETKVTVVPNQLHGEHASLHGEGAMPVTSAPLPHRANRAVETLLRGLTLHHEDPAT